MKFKNCRKLIFACLVFSTQAIAEEPVDILASFSLKTVNGKTSCTSSDPNLCPRLEEEQKLESQTHKQCLKDIKLAPMLVDACLSSLRKTAQEQGKSSPQDSSNNPKLSQDHSKPNQASPMGSTSKTTVSHSAGSGN